MDKKLLRMTLLIISVIICFARINAQGPSASYYYLQTTELPWAECYAYMEGGSRQKIIIHTAQGDMTGEKIK